METDFTMIQPKTYHYYGFLGLRNSARVAILLFVMPVLVCLVMLGGIDLGAALQMGSIVGLFLSLLVWLFSLSSVSYSVDIDGLTIRRPLYRRHVRLEDVSNITTKTSRWGNLFVVKILVLVPAEEHSLIHAARVACSTITIKSDVEGFSDLLSEVCHRCHQAYIDPFTRIIADLASRRDVIYFGKSDDGKKSGTAIDITEFSKMIKELQMQEATEGHSNPGIQRLIGLACLIVGRRKEAVGELNSLAGAQDDKQLRFELGLARYCDGDFENARKEFAFSERSDLATETLLGCSCLQCGDADEAAKHFSVAERLQGTEESAHIPDCTKCLRSVQWYAGKDIASLSRKREMILSIGRFAWFAVLMVNFICPENIMRALHFRNWFAGLVILSVLYGEIDRYAFGPAAYKYCWLGRVWSAVKRDGLRMGAGIKAKQI